MDEMLVPEAWIHGHDQHKVQIRQHLLQDRSGRRGVDRQPDPFSQTLNPVNRPVQIVIALPVHDERIRAGLNEFIEEEVRVGNHQMRFQRQARHLP